MKMSDEILPLVSVVIPTYKRPHMLGRAIESVLNQSYGSVEVIVVDDNPPRSLERLKTQKVVSEYPTVVYLETTGRTGGGAARNFACRFVNGEYITFLDDDDVYLKDKVSNQISFMLENDLDFSYEDCALYDVNDHLVDYRKLDFVKDFNRNELLRQHILHSLGPSSVYMIKSSKFNETDGFGEYSMGQDWFFMLRCIEANLIMGYLSMSDVKQYLHNEERISLGRNKIDGENFVYSIRKDYFKYLTKRERQYVRFRHRAVLMFSCMRSKMYIDGLKYCLAAFITSPSISFIEAVKYIKKDKV